MVDVKVPAVGESISEVTIASWLKKEGDFVKLDEAICSIESDKATLEISAPKAGKLKILVKEGETVGIGTKIAEVDETASGSASTSTAQAVISTAGATTATAQAVIASTKASEALASANSFTINFAQMATSLITTQAVVAQYHAFN